MKKPCFSAAALDSADAFRVQHRHRAFGIAFGHNRYHSDPHVEHVIHFLAIDLSAFADKIENFRDAPAARVDNRIAIFRQDARDVID